MSYRHYHQRDPIKNYFPLPNEIFSLGLSFGEIAVYAYTVKTGKPTNVIPATRP